MNNSLLYISIDEKKRTGGSLCRTNNKLALEKTGCFSIKEYLIELKPSKFAKAISVLLGFKAGLTYKHIKTIVKKINNENHSFVFIDTSLYGKLVKIISKQTAAKVFTFFHNCEYEIYRQEYKKFFKRSLILNSVKINEYYSVKFSHACIFLTDRDLQACEKNYGISPLKYFITPIALEDVYKKIPLKIEEKRPKTLLFVGSYFYPNIRGMAWFINNVLPKVSYKLVIVGKGFESIGFKNLLKDFSKVEFKGFVDDLEAEYENANIVVQPVFEGSGMKTKTAECLMYGKPLISTSEGLIGYDVDGLVSIFKCNDAESFINALNELSNIELSSFYIEENKRFKYLYSIEARTLAYKNNIK